MKNGLWWMIVVIGLSVLIPLGVALAQEKAEAPKEEAAPAPAKVEAKAEAKAAAPALELSKDAAAAEAKNKEFKSELGIMAVIWKSGWFGVAIWLLLFAGSIASVALIVDSYITIREKKIAPQSVVDGARSRRAMFSRRSIAARKTRRPSPGFSCPAW